MATSGPVPATNQHYDQDPNLFALFLGSTMKYSAGLFTTGDESLDDAQRAKMDWVLDVLGVGPDDRLLDVGCGWGSVVVHAAATVGCHTVGITPSARQRETVLERAAATGVADRVEVRVGMIEDTELAGRSFRAVSMLGSIVHMPERDAVLDRCVGALRRRGRLYVSESCFRSRTHRAEFTERPSTAFVRDEIFGTGDMVPLSTLIAAFEDAGLSIELVRDLTDDYRLTIERWADAVERRRDEVERVQPGGAARLLRYFEIANAGWGYTTKHYAILGVKRR